MTPCGCGIQTRGNNSTHSTGIRDWVLGVSFSPDGCYNCHWEFGLYGAVVERKHRRTNPNTHGVYGERLIACHSVQTVRPLPLGDLTLPDGRGTDTKVRLWDTNTGEQIQALTGHRNWVPSVSFSPDGSTLASASADDTVRLWDANTGEQLQTLMGYTGSVYSVSFSPDGSTIATGNGDNTVRLWDANTGEQLQTLTGYTGRINSVLFSPDGSTIATGNGDNTVRLWDANTGDQLRALTGHTEWGRKCIVQSKRFHPRQCESGQYGAVVGCQHGRTTPNTHGAYREMSNSVVVQSRRFYNCHWKLGQHGAVVGYKHGRTSPHDHWTYALDYKRVVQSRRFYPRHWESGWHGVAVGIPQLRLPFTQKALAMPTPTDVKGRHHSLHIVGVTQ